MEIYAAHFVLISSISIFSLSPVTSCPCAQKIHAGLWSQFNTRLHGQDLLPTLA